ncbi:hypothetical protein [Rhodococcus sp. NPDC059234]|uniref:hypothetical protein n=1 Tax=Rhodococcus sp. NPDC059234 TaxID=3346781 RepID=UPI0036710E38
MLRPAMRRLASTVLVAAVLTGGLAAGSGAATAVTPDAGELPASGSAASANEFAGNVASSLFRLVLDQLDGLDRSMGGSVSGSLIGCKKEFCGAAQV